MKLRAVIVGLALSAAAAAVANCGSEGGSEFGSSGGTEDGGGSSGSSGNGFGTQEEGGASSSGGGTCKPLTCADLKINCGPAGDGCGGVIQDCGKCQGLETCGGGGVPSVCGGTQGCQPKTCQDLGIGCGPAGDGCGGTLDCKACTPPQICGGGGPSKCGGGQSAPDGGVLLPDGGACVARTTCNAGECGPVADGCGGILTCGGCTAGQTCGGGGVPSQCGAPSCTKTTCTAQGANCGYIADGCGGLLDCGGSLANKGCSVAGQICGGGGPNKCGAGADAGTGCTGFCPAQAPNDSCAVGQKTKLTGKVFAPNGTLPLPDATIYIPNGSTTFPYGVQAFTDGVAGGTCEQCNVQSSGPPLGGVTVKSDEHGNFTLDNVPVGVDFPLVIQLGRWRRLVTIPARTACTTTALTAAQTRLPTRQFEGNSRDNIPLIAISTGQVDGLECVFRKLGIEQSQFGNPTGTATNAGGRIRLYRDNDVGSAKGGARIDNNTPRTDSALTDTQAHLDQYDAVIMSCAGAANNRGQPILDRVRAYADKGGRVFSTHYEYVYLYTNQPWGGGTQPATSTAAWDANSRNPLLSVGGNDTPVSALVDETPGKRLLFSKWLADPLVNALTATNPPRLTITEARNDVDRPVSTGAEEWISYYQDPSPPVAVLHYTFNTPWGAASANQCGRVLYSDFHVSIGNTNGTTFPAECGNPLPALTAQEKVLAFFLFDLTSCIEPTQPPPPPTCTKLSCAAQNIACGQAGDGCGGFQTCPTCPDGQLCINNACVTPACTKKDCASQGAQCGIVPDGCGSTVNCGPCTQPGQVCGGGGPNLCGSNSCTPIDCNTQNIHCGPAGNGCGGLLDCGPCPPGQTCGGGGQAGICGAPNCTPRSCQQANAQCGFVANGCGGLLDCGPCPTGQSCGGGGVPNQCGGGSIPK